MRRISLVAAAMAAVLWVAAPMAQGKADFSGSWTLVQDPNAAPGGGAPGGGGGGRRGGRGGGAGGGICGPACTITQDGMTLTVTRMAQGGEQKAMYRLDGSESKNTQQGRGGEIEIVSTAKWTGNNLTITTTRPGRQGGAPITQTSVLSMSGGQLVIENTTDFGQGPQTTKQTYTKG